MDDARRVWACRALAGTGALLAMAGSVYLLIEDSEMFWEWGTFMAAPFGIFFAALARLVVARQPHNPILWVLAVSGFFWGVYAAGGAGVAITFPGDAALMVADPTVAPIDLPSSTAWIMTFTFTGWVPALFPLVTLGLLLFPDGKPPSPRWRWAPAAAVVGISLSTVLTWWEYRPTATIPYNQGSFSTSTTTTVLLAGGLATVGLSLAALVVRFRRSRGETRQQFKWVVWGGTVFVFGVFAAFLFEGSRYQSVANMLFVGGGGVFLLSYAIAVGRYRLYDIDIVISRTFVFGALAAFITGVYIAAVLGVGGFLGGDAESSPWLAIGATAVVAFAFEPVRARLQRWANRLVYGRRATPYEVLSDFSQRIGADDKELLNQVARSLADGTTAAGASVWVTVEGSLTRVAEWPEGDAMAVLSGPAGSDVVRPVIHDGETLGVLALSTGRGQSIQEADERLLDQMAAAMGLALRNLRLGEDLRRQVDELQRSRHRLLAVQDETRRQLERELHDGAQQRLVALKLKLGVARTRALEAAITEVAELLEQVTADTGRAVDSLRDLARGIYPPLLEAEGAKAALSAQLGKLPLPVTLHAPGLGRCSPEIEAAVYYCVLEALQNVAKHSGAGSAHVVLKQTNGHLVFEVTDDGRGFDPGTVERGSGLANLVDRLDALDGSIEIVSSPGAGTTVRGRVPSGALEAAL